MLVDDAGVVSVDGVSLCVRWCGDKENDFYISYFCILYFCILYFVFCILYFVFCILCFVFAHLIHALWFLDNWYFETNILPGQSVHINLLHLNINLTLERNLFSQQFYFCFPTFLLSLNISRKTAGSRTLSAWKMAWLILKLSKLKQRLKVLIQNFHWIQYLKGYVLRP